MNFIRGILFWGNTVVGGRNPIMRIDYIKNLLPSEGGQHDCFNKAVRKYYRITMDFDKTDFAQK